jgi:hypothetical protein
MATSPLERRIQLAGIILLLGLIVEVLSLLGHGAVAFLVFSGLCATLIVVGILLYLHGLVSSVQHPESDADR